MDNTNRAQTESTTNFVWFTKVKFEIAEEIQLSSLAAPSIYSL